MKPIEERVLLDGPAGKIDVIIEIPAHPKGIALVAHPHPIGGGANTNKVAHTLAKTFLGLGYIALRPNFRTVGGTEGDHDEGIGETDDLFVVLAEARKRFGEYMPIVLSGFSFGAFCQTRLHKMLTERGIEVQKLVLVGTAAGFVEGTRQYDTETVPADTLVIHGSADETVPLTNVMAWAQPQDLSIVVVPGADHFFHRRLHCLRDIINRAWHAVE